MDKDYIDISIEKLVEDGMAFDDALDFMRVVFIKRIQMLNAQSDPKDIILNGFMQGLEYIETLRQDAQK